MNKTSTLLDKIRDNKASWEDYAKILTLDEESMDSVFELAQEIKTQNLGQTLKIYTPGAKFPAYSVTGEKCALSCEHCNEKYLRGMKSATEPSELKEKLINLSKEGGVGALISGGCTTEGFVPLKDFSGTLSEIKKETDLIINTHTGLLNEETAQKLSDAGVDIVSFDVNMDPEIIHQIYHLEKDLEDYEKAIEILKANNLNIVPHVCIGLYYGELHKELESLKFIKDSRINPSLIVFIALIPPNNSEKSFKTPNPLDIAKIIAIARFAFPSVEISLGCMRPRRKIKMKVEKLAFNAGITRIEIPSKKTLDWIRKSYPNTEFKFFSACCAIPQKFEERAKSSKAKIKKYI
ncbi:MAG: Biotin synthase [Promethearchaeota archaeon]|nr:MAG: Biotin synthase [Candidatus Lokiarchaeota archaeon]